MKNHGRLASAAIAGVVCAAQVAGESGRFDLLESYVHDYTVIGEPPSPAARCTGRRPSPGAAAALSRRAAVTAPRAWSMRRNSAGGAEALCVFTDPSGDKWYALVKESSGCGKGNQRIVGGTGRFAGVTGNCPLRRQKSPGQAARRRLDLHVAKTVTLPSAS